MKLAAPFVALLSLFTTLPHAASAADPKPNVLFIAIDDMRDWVHYLGYQQVKTPNLDRLASRGLAFTHSYCAAPVCNPSRTALMSGLRPSTSGVYTNHADWRKIIPDVETLPMHFRAGGYYVAGAGKIYHESFNRLSDWDDYLPTSQAEAAESDDPAGAPAGKGGKKGKGKGKGKAGITSDAKDDGVGGIKFKPLNCEDKDMVDYAIVSYCLKQLQQPHEKPLFLACGIHKPHMPWDVPKKYYDMYPLESIQLPPILEHDLDDVPPAGVAMAHKQGDHARILASGRWKEAVQGYLAAITFSDAMVGRLLEGFDSSPYKANTVICLWSDHGWHLGEKEHWRKFALWEEATHAPFIMSVPGMTKPGTTCARTTDYMNIYPTLCDLCGLSIPSHVQGVSLRPLLENPTAKWDRPALTTHEFKNHAVRTEDWRFIRYANGDEELYNEQTDPHEWTNLAKDEHYANVKVELAKSFPANDAHTPGNGQKGKGPGKAAKKAAKGNVPAATPVPK